MSMFSKWWRKVKRKLAKWFRKHRWELLAISWELVPLIKEASTKKMRGWEKAEWVLGKAIERGYAARLGLADDLEAARHLLREAVQSAFLHWWFKEK